MLQVSFLRQNKEIAKKKLAIKHFSNLDLVDTIIAFDDERKQLQAAFDEIQAKVNSASKEIGGLMAKGEKDKAEDLKNEVAGLKIQLEPLKVKMAEVEVQLHNTLVQLPNLPHDLVPIGKTPEENEVVKQGGETPKLHAGAQAHWDLISKYNLVDFETGAKITGSGFPLYIGKGAKFQRALVQYFLDFNITAGYTEYLPPFMVNEASAFATGQLPDKEGQMYHATADNFYLIPTAEVPVTNIYRDVVLKEADLPLQMTAYSPCFRREAGSFGKEVRGLNRVHQFEKIEIIQIVHPDKSDEVLQEMVAHVEKLLVSLGLQYRILRLCGGDMGFASAITYDFEVYSAAQERWLEVSSVSNFQAYQTYRMKCRFKDAAGKIQFAHSLNGSSLALPRIFAAIVENYQTEAGIALPKVLQSYFGAENLI
ncbi:MAG: serine--tRNA ligase [Bacteroidetes bacterium]|nr:serine--tRNA ligase [Bacteroidota bacterium]